MELGKFLGWALPKTTVVYEGDPLLTLERLFPVDELFEALRNTEADRRNEQERESVEWFMELMQQRDNRGRQQNLLDNDPPADAEFEDVDAVAEDVQENQPFGDGDDAGSPDQI